MDQYELDWCGAGARLEIPRSETWQLVVKETSQPPSSDHEKPFGYLRWAADRERETEREGEREGGGETDRQTDAQTNREQWRQREREGETMRERKIERRWERE